MSNELEEMRAKAIVVIDEWCDWHNLSIVERLKMKYDVNHFSEVDGVQQTIDLFEELNQKSLMKKLSSNLK